MEINEELGYEPDLIELEDEDGQMHHFEVLDATDIENVRHFLLTPISETDEDDEADEEEEGFVIMRLAKDGEEEFLEVVENRQELENAVQVFSSRLEDLFDIDLDS